MKSANHIALICDDAYVIPTVVTIQSIKECVVNFDDCKLFIHVCTPGLIHSNIVKLESLADDKVDVSVCIPDFSSMNDKIVKVRQKTHVSTAALIKFELPNIFPNLDRILYLDTDICVKKDFIKIFSTSLSDSYLAAVFEFWNYLNDLMYNPSHIKKNEFYFNSGVMLMNLKKMREDSIPEKLWDYKMNYTKTSLMDQECFNKICSENLQHLSIEWNLNPIFLEDKYISMINKVYNTNFKDKNEIYENAKVIHYVGKKDKPWIYKDARQNKLWQSFYEKVYPDEPLCLKTFEKAHSSLLKRTISSIKEHGLNGFFNYMRYKFFFKGSLG